VATLPGALGGSRAVAPVVNVSIDARGAMKDDARDIGAEVERGVRVALREVLRGGGQYGASVDSGVV